MIGLIKSRNFVDKEVGFFGTRRTWYSEINRTKCTQSSLEKIHAPCCVLGLVSAKVPLSKMCWSHWMNLCGQDGDIWKLLDYRFSSWGTKTYQKGLGESEFILKNILYYHSCGTKDNGWKYPNLLGKAHFFLQSHGDMFQTVQFILSTLNMHILKRLLTVLAALNLKIVKTRQLQVCFPKHPL